MKSKKQIGLIVLFAFFVFSLSQCSDFNSIEARLGKMPIPAENPQTQEKIELGKKLFFDKRLSKDNAVSCASCHITSLAFTDRKAKSRGFHGRISMRNAPTLLNVGFQHTLMFDGEIPSLEMQTVVPIKDSSEMASEMKILIPKLRAITKYQEAAKRIFDRNFDAYVLTRALASFQRTLVSYQTPWDDFNAGDKSALNKIERGGWKLFSQKLYCTKCHAPPHFTNFETENNGLYESYKNIEDKGRYRINGDSLEIGSFKVPTLRNIAITGPYMHDGSINTLDEIIDHYKKGGNGHKNQHPIIRSFALTAKEKKALIAFLKTLSDPQIID